ncbi:MAG TPA: peptidase M48 [Bacteroidales bacterium]|jgi:STE24 endopeptidase|nr:peptidase M48 [Bacteroidales bacterium]
MNNILLIILILISLNYLFELLLDVLNLRYRSKAIPNILSDVYDISTYAKQQEYKTETTKFSFIQGALSFVAIFFVLYFGLLGKLHGYIAQFGFSGVTTTLAFFGILFIVGQIMSIPFSLWSIFVIEEKYGFNRVTPRLFVFDFLKSIFLAVILGGGLLALITLAFQISGQWFWLIALAIMLLFSLLANALYSRVIIPLFNKQTPLASGDLYDDIKELAQKVGFPVNKVFVIDGSKRSSKANAYFTGFGRNRRVILYDTLINSMQNNEILAVLSHEIGHYKKKHIWMNFALGGMQMAIILYVFNLFAQSTDLSIALGYSNATEPIFHLSLIAFGLLFMPIEHIIGIGTNMMSRKMEYQADEFASKLNYGNELISALKKLSKESLSNLTPHPAYVFVNYSHPTLFLRVRKILDRVGHQTKK